MTEETQVIDEVKEEVVQQVDTTQEKTQEQNDKEINFSNMRSKLKEKDYLLSERERQLKEMEERLRALQEQNKPQAVEEDYSDDDYTPRKTAKRDAERIAEQKIKEYEEKNWKRVVKTDYPDFDEVASIENIQMLEEQMPEISSLIMKAGSKTDMAVATYKAIKRMKKINSIDKEIEQNTKQMEKNKDKPMSTAAVDKRPIAQVAKYSDQDYEELWKEMHHYANKA